MKTLKNVKWSDTKNYFRLVPFFLILLLFFVGIPTAWGHAFVTEESPAPNSYLENSPSEVKVLFNSKVEKNFFSIKLIGEDQKEVTSQSAVISDNQKELRLQLPALDGGIYKVEYSVISSNDGHPVQGSYVFQVANAPVSNEQNNIKQDEIEIPTPVPQQLGEDGSKNNVIEQTDPTLGKPDKQANKSAEILNFSDLFFHILRVFYYCGLLFLIGWIFLWRLVQNYDADVKKKFLFWGIILQMLHLVGLLSVILIQLNMFTINGLSFSLELPLQVNFSLLWMVSLFMSLLGLIFLFKNQWFDIFWILVIVFSKSISGHALEFEPTIILVITNSIHLYAASIWAAGLMFIALFWRKHIIYVKSFLPQFSKYAFLSIVVLSITGLFSSYIYLSGFDLLFSDRGILLMIKTVMVLFVILIGIIIRCKMNEMKTMDLKKWIKIDLLLMFLLILIVSILTYLNPLQ